MDTGEWRSLNTLGQLTRAIRLIFDAGFDKIDPD